MGLRSEAMANKDKRHIVTYILHVLDNMENQEDRIDFLHELLDASYEDGSAEGEQYNG